MARTSNNGLLKGVHGKIGGQLVVKQYGDKTVISAMPDMSMVKQSELQKNNNNKFADAVKFAQGIIRDPVKHKAYSAKLKKGQTVYQYAISEYMSRSTA